jgi:hypothetical protein
MADMNEHVVAWLRHDLGVWYKTAGELRRAWEKEQTERMRLEYSMPVNMDRDVSVPCQTCGTKMSFTRPALQFMLQRSPTGF